MEQFGFDIIVKDQYGKRGRVTGFGSQPRNTREEEWKEKERIYKKAIRLGKTFEEVKQEEEKKKQERYLKQKYKRYLKEVEKLKDELNYKMEWIEKYEKEKE